jgi:hypothetical protein
MLFIIVEEFYIFWFLQAYNYEVSLNQNYFFSEK